MYLNNLTSSALRQQITYDTELIQGCGRPTKNFRWLKHKYTCWPCLLGKRRVIYRPGLSLKRLKSILSIRFTSRCASWRTGLTSRCASCRTYLTSLAPLNPESSDLDRARVVFPRGVLFLFFCQKYKVAYSYVQSQSILSCNNLRQQVTCSHCQHGRLQNKSRGASIFFFGVRLFFPSILKWHRVLVSQQGTETWYCREYVYCTLL